MPDSPVARMPKPIVRVVASGSWMGLCTVTVGGGGDVSGGSSAGVSPGACAYANDAEPRQMTTPSFEIFIMRPSPVRPSYRSRVEDRRRFRRQEVAGW